MMKENMEQGIQEAIMLEDKIDNPISPQLNNVEPLVEQ